MRLIYHPAVQADVESAVAFYESRVAGLGAGFIHEFDEAIKVVLRAPEIWPIVRSEVRRYAMARFPYGIYHRCNTEEVRVLVVKHHHRRPEFGLRRKLDP